MGYNDFVVLLFGHVLATCHINCTSDKINIVTLAQYAASTVLSRVVSSFNILFFIFEYKYDNWGPQIYLYICAPGVKIVVYL